jgi:hypothetical protein
VNRNRHGLIIDGAQRYTVVRRDTLSAIARARYRNGFYFPVIMLASDNVVRDMDRIRPGMVLTIPDLQRNLNDPQARAVIKQALLNAADVSRQRRRTLDAAGLRRLANSL